MSQVFDIIFMGAAFCYSLQRLGSCVPQLVNKQVFPLLEGLAALVTDVVPLLCKTHRRQVHAGNLQSEASEERQSERER